MVNTVRFVPSIIYSLSDRQTGSKPMIIQYDLFILSQGIFTGKSHTAYLI